jgi:hypothetical protein
MARHTLRTDDNIKRIVKRRVPGFIWLRIGTSEGIL